MFRSLSKVAYVASRGLTSTKIEPLFYRVLIKNVEAEVQTLNSNRHFSSQKPNGLNNKIYSTKKEPTDGGDQSVSLIDILEREIQDETAELNQHLSTDQFPGFSVETDDSDVKLSKQVNGATVNVRFTVSSSLNEWPSENHEPQADGQQQEENENISTNLVSMPEFQVQINKNNHTLELSCYFEELETDEETGATYPDRPVFGIDELVMYEGEPKETEFAVSAEYFQEDLQEALLKYLADHGIDDDFAQNLVSFSTSYEKKQYIGLMNRLKKFVSK